MDEIIIKKFWENVEKTDSCWNWDGFLDKYKSPIIRITNNNKQKDYSPRRISLLLSGKQIFTKDYIVVTCKNKLCVNPDHLVCGNEGRFWSKVQKLPEPNDCWVWTGFLNEKMYGRFSIRKNRKSTLIFSHIYSWELYSGRPVPKDCSIVVCHKCDHPWCVNPQHLFLGTQQDNIDDKCAKGRQAKGETHGLSKLTEEQVKEIRSLYPKINGKQLAKMYGIADVNIYKLLKRETWGHIE